MSPKVRHTNNGRCLKCQEILDLYPGFHAELRMWFEAFQLRYNDAHVSDAGRGKKRQEQYLKAGSSFARWAESAHNWNAALDIFWLVAGKAYYGMELYNSRLKPALLPWILWGMEWKGKMREAPHVEVRDWKALAKNKTLSLVEEP